MSGKPEPPLAGIRRIFPAFRDVPSPSSRLRSSRQPDKRTNHSKTLAGFLPRDGSGATSSISGSGEGCLDGHDKLDVRGSRIASSWRLSAHTMRT